MREEDPAGGRTDGSAAGSSTDRSRTRKWRMGRTVVVMDQHGGGGWGDEPRMGRPVVVLMAQRMVQRGADHVAAAFSEVFFRI